MTKYNRLFLFLALLMVTCTVSTAEDLGLSDAIDIALETNYDIRIVQSNVEIAETGNTWGAAGRLPTISFGLSSINRANFNETSDNTSLTLSPDVTLNWVLFNGFAIRTRKERLDTFEKLSRGNAAYLVEQTVQSVVLAYYKALFEQEKLEVLGQVMSLSQDRYDYMQMRKEIGSSVTYDVLQAKNAWLEDKSAVLLQEVTLENAVRDLRYLMGISEETDYTFTDEFSAELNDYQWQPLNDKMLSNNTTLRNQYLNQVLREKEITLAKSLFFPRVTMNSGLDANSNRLKHEGAPWTDSNSWSASANFILSYSLFDGGAKKRALRIAKIEEDTGRIEIDEMKHSLTNQLAKLLDLYDVRKDLLNVADENRETAQLNLQISEDKFRAGTINSFNYRDVQLIYLNASLGRLQAIYNLIDSDTALARLTGGIVTEK